ncbi:hypothetical protein Gohar_019874 [Gossypium harknessii]|uniref:DUF4283 domain-containing protein n=1 Tax=Gossypium harknessii TaxID=34285 RepID=A0A7J9HXE5_9ROSI|nr:hypothetical protein [Gossypium harknessii]
MDCLPVWIHLKHVPLELFTGGGLSYIASALGNPLYMDRITASKQRLPYAKLKFPGCLRNVVIVTITNEGDMTTTQLKLLLLALIHLIQLGKAASMGIVTLMQAMKTKKKGKIESSRSMCLSSCVNLNGPDISFAAVCGSNIGGERKRLWEHLKDVKESVGSLISSAKHPDFMKTVEQSWKEPVDGDPMSRLVKQSRQPIKLLTYDDDNRLETYEQISMESIRFYSGLIGTADKGVKGLFNPIS